MFIINTITQLLSHVEIQTNLHQNISFSHRHPTCTPFAWIEQYLDPSTKPPYYQIGRGQYYGISFLFFVCVDLELRKIVIYSSLLKALYPTFPYLVDSSPPTVIDSRVPKLPGSQKFWRSFRSCPSLPPSHTSQCTLIMPLLVTSHQTHRKDWH